MAIIEFYYDHSCRPGGKAEKCFIYTNNDSIYGVLPKDLVFFVNYSNLYLYQLSEVSRTLSIVLAEEYGAPLDESDLASNRIPAHDLVTPKLILSTIHAILKSRPWLILLFLNKST